MRRSGPSSADASCSALACRCPRRAACGHSGVAEHGVGAVRVPVQPGRGDHELGQRPPRRGGRPGQRPDDLRAGDQPVRPTGGGAAQHQRADPAPGGRSRPTGRPCRPSTCRTRAPARRRARPAPRPRPRRTAGCRTPRSERRCRRCRARRAATVRYRAARSGRTGSHQCRELAWPASNSSGSPSPMTSKWMRAPSVGGGGAHGRRFCPATRCFSTSAACRIRIRASRKFYSSSAAISSHHSYHP